MKHIILKICIVLSCILNFSQTIAQVKTKIYPDGLPNKKLINNYSFNEIRVAAPANFETLKQNAADPKYLSEFKNKFAETINVDYDIIKLAKESKADKATVLLLKCSVDKALNLSFQFSDFKLSPNAVLSIYTNFELTDSITAKENNQGNIWATRVYQGNELYFKLSVPIDEVLDVKLKIKTISLGYRQVGGGFFGNPGNSGNCNINVVCPPGAGWENERNSVAMIVSGGNEICTGTLIMNTCGTNRPYLLTANHCLNSNVANWVFQFQTWSTDCVTNNGWREDVQFNGCQLRANNAATDFALVELNQIPAPNSGITYSGWSRNGNPPAMTTSIHHPSGDLMKIIHDFQPPVSVSWFNGPNNHWRATFDQGIVQHGSSGSALFDENRRLIGQLHGNQNNICNVGDNNCFCNIQLPSIGEYGRFDVSWIGGGTNTTRLSNWLDPANSNQLTTNTTNVSNLQPAPSVNVNTLAISGPQLICNSSDYSITNLPTGAIVTWSIPGSAGPVLQLSPNTPVPNQLRITNQKWYTVTTTLTAVISNLGCGIPNQTRVLTIANDNSTSASVPHSYFQEACTFYNVSHPSQSGTIVSNSSPVFVHQGCMVYVNLGDMTGRTVTLGSGGTPLFWSVGTTSYYQNTLFFQLPLGSGGIPFTFNITGNGACFQRTLLFFSYTGNARYAFAATPNPTRDQLLVTAKEDEKFLAENKLRSTKNKLQFIMNIYDVNTNTLQMTQRSGVGNMQHSLNVSRLKTGYYVLQIVNGKETQSIKFFKE